MELGSLFTSYINWHSLILFFFNDRDILNEQDILAESHSDIIYALIPLQVLFVILISGYIASAKHPVKTTCSLNTSFYCSVS